MKNTCVIILMEVVKKVVRRDGKVSCAIKVFKFSCSSSLFSGYLDDGGHRSTRFL